MSDAGHDHPDPPAAEPPAKPRIVIELGGLTGADCTIRWEGEVSTGQLYAAAWTLDAYAREVRAGEVAQAAAGLVGNPAEALAILGKLGITVPGGPPREGGS